jgi:putative transposase
MGNFMEYRRRFVLNGSYFFTVVTQDRNPVFLEKAAVDLLRQAFRHVMNKRPFIIDAIVIMPDHLHCIWTLPENDCDYPTRWRLIKTYFTKNYGQTIWQHRYWEHCIRDERDFENHVNYIHNNPVKHGLVLNAKDWEHSSIHRNKTT